MEQASFNQTRPPVQAVGSGVILPDVDRDDPPVQSQMLPGTGFGTDRLQTLQFAAVMMPQMAYIDSSRLNARGGPRSRTALEGSTGLAQHQRVHDADESGFTVVHESGNRLTGYYDPNRSVVFQTSVRERSHEWRDEGRKKRAAARARKRKNAGDSDQPTLVDEVFDTVVRVAQAAWTVATHRAHVEQAAKQAPQPEAFSPVLALALRSLVRDAAVPGLRRRAQAKPVRASGRALRTRIVRR